MNYTYSEDSSFDSDSETDSVNDPIGNNNPLRTEKGALTLATTQDALVDCFYKTIRGIDDTYLRKLLEDSWAYSPLDTIKLIFFIRDIRGKGKGEKKIFHQACKWLIDVHSDAIKHNYQHVPFYGCYKDWYEIFLQTRYEKAILKALARQLRSDLITISENDDKRDKKDGYFSFLWKLPKITEHVSVSLAWKWTPSENSHYDKGQYKGTVSKLCKILGMSKKEYRKAGTFMRGYLNIVEAKMCGKEWEEIDFSKVPSRAMNIYKKAYSKHQTERFGKYIEDVTSGKAKMNTGTLQPHEIITQALSNHKDDPIVEAQWVSFLKGLKDKGLSFDNTVSVVDTSGSMNGIPRQVAYALGLVTSHFCTGLFHDKWIEFSSQAKLHKFPNGTLHQKIKSINSIIDSTNIKSVFDLILNTYEMFDVPAEKQIKRVFIFTDGQWDSMVSHADLTTFQGIEKMYTDAGYTRPTLIFWNLRAGTIDFPVQADTPDTALVSGFSSDLLQLFLEGGDMNPLSLVHKAIRDERYDRVIL